MAPFFAEILHSGKAWKKEGGHIQTPSGMGKASLAQRVTGLGKKPMMRLQVYPTEAAGVRAGNGHRRKRLHLSLLGTRLFGQVMLPKEGFHRTIGFFFNRNILPALGVGEGIGSVTISLSGK